MQRIVTHDSLIGRCDTTLSDYSYPMSPQPLYVRFDDADALALEFDRNLQHGGTFIPKITGYHELDPCEVILVHPTDHTELRLAATIVWVSANPDNIGVGIGINDFNKATRETIAAFIAGPTTRTPVERPLTLQEQLRGLSSTEQIKVARGNDVPARVMLEKLYGKMVWEAILRNQRVTVPEVARIAKMGALPKHLFDIIGGNSAWLRVPQIRRALLSNTKTPMDVIEKLLRLTPRHELRLIAKQSIYSTIIRDRAKRILGQG